jgi:hypothetical protein
MLIDSTLEEVKILIARWLLGLASPQDIDRSKEKRRDLQRCGRTAIKPNWRRFFWDNLRGDVQEIF